MKTFVWSAPEPYNVVVVAEDEASARAQALHILDTASELSWLEQAVFRSLIAESPKRVMVDSGSYFILTRVGVK